MAGPQSIMHMDHKQGESNTTTYTVYLEKSGSGTGARS